MYIVYHEWCNLYIVKSNYKEVIRQEENSSYKDITFHQQMVPLQ